MVFLGVPTQYQGCVLVDLRVVVEAQVRQYDKTIVPWTCRYRACEWDVSRRDDVRVFSLADVVN